MCGSSRVRFGVGPEHLFFASFSPTLLPEWACLALYFLYKPKRPNMEGKQKDLVRP